MIGALGSRDDGLHTVRELAQPRPGKLVATCVALDARGHVSRAACIGSGHAVVADHDA